ncbi:PREDICTED: uncharacterized protein LOC108378590 [Rhagoletis zephyria]|uniref:uncharacterized protein LOC108378590 n=1 Tax=Rhagoletis zephyria TaxID=28612 RepID=UPI0008116DEC|nr:PREDICTED: uncharacterized protein LOC108378590 [Rhagoletis zephyria]
MTRLNKSELQNALEIAGITYPATSTVSQLRALLDGGRMENSFENDSGVAAAAGGESNVRELNADEISENENLDAQIAMLEKRKKMLLLQKELQALELEAPSARQRISVMDIDGIVPKFSGDNAYPIEKWINGFDYAVKVGYKDDHFKYMCMRRLLSGTAVIFLRTSSAELKVALLKQYKRNISTNDVYKELYRRRRLPNEGIICYMLSMKEISAQASLVEHEVISAVIEGLRYNTAYTSILYTAKNLDELRELFIRYEENRTSDSATRNIQQRAEGGTKSESNVICFHCSQIGHLSKQCKQPKRAKGSCFRCGSKDHLLNQCNQPSTKTTVNAVAEEPTDPDVYNVEPYQTW